MGLTADPRARGNSIVGDLVRGFFRHGIDVKEEAGSAIGYEQGLKHYCFTVLHYIANYISKNVPLITIPIHYFQEIVLTIHFHNNSLQNNTA